MMKNTLGRACLLLSMMTFPPSNLGFHLTTTTQKITMTRHLPTTRRSSHVQQRSIRGDGVQLRESFWQKPSSSSSSKDNDDDTANSSGEIVEEEEETKPLLDKDEDDSSPSVEVVSTDDIIDVETSSASTTKELESASTNTEDISSSSSSSNNKSLLTLLNEVGEKFKTMAQKSTANGIKSKNQSTKILYAANACLYYTLFIIYRTYRGFFVLLPATVRQVYHQMEVVMNTGNLDMIDENDDDTTTDTVKKNSWRTKITVSLLTSVVTVSYICGGVLKLVSKFVRTMFQTSNVTKSFEAAADEMGNFEGRISRVGKGKSNDNDNEDENNIEPSSGLV
jgi:hypothetical protein